ncbi:MAG: Holliday junction resolvase RuvX [Armatimonadota bacterium]
MKLMGLDIGEKRIGVALSDDTGSFAFPFTTIVRTVSEKADLRSIVRIIEEENVSKVIAGIPIMLSGQEAVQAEKIRAFAGKLARRLRIPLEYWDERYSTAEAERMLIDAGKSREARKNIIDKAAAAVILQSYIDAKGNDS